MTNADLPGEGLETARILHELAGALSTVLGFAQLVERRPDHPRAAEFTTMIKAEAERAVEALRDLQLLRALRADAVVEKVEAVPARELLARIASRVRSAQVEVDEGPAAGPAGDALVECDVELFADVAARCFDAAAAGGNPGVRVEARGGHVVFSVGFGAAAEREDLQERIDGLFPEARPIVVAGELLRRWGGAAAVVEAGSEVRLELLLRAPDAQLAGSV